MDRKPNTAADFPGLRIREVRSWRTVLRRAEIGEYEGLLDDPASGLVIENGCLRVPRTAGLGVRVDLTNAVETQWVLAAGRDRSFFVNKNRSRPAAGTY